ncbi:MAG: SirB2 family protein [Rhizobacter sp.]|nr:SirB2 family protein [Rhizobacter sp.]
MEYATLRDIHIACAGISIVLFVSRGAMQLAGIDWRRSRWLRIAPHLNDTLLLGAAVALAVMSAQYPLAQGWLTAKVGVLLFYIGLGRIALQPGRSRQVQASAFVAALASVGYIVGAALTRSASLGLG